VISVIHVEDAVRGLRAMAEYAGRGGTQRVFCLADDEPVPVLTFHSHLANLLGAPPVQLTSVRRVRLLIGVVRFLARVVGQKAPITEDLIRMATLDVHMQNRRMRRELGLEPRYPTYREGLAQVAAALGAEEEE
jgi:nucleoside-diphosphate-sugar epimerase